MGARELLAGVLPHHHPTCREVWGPLIGPLVAIVSFVCSIGNVPLAAVLWNGGISFGGVIAFIFADLIVLPILDIYRSTTAPHGRLPARHLLCHAWSRAGYVVELLFGALGLIPTDPHSAASAKRPSLNYTTVLNIVFLALAAVLVVRFVTTGGLPMLRMMDTPSGEAHSHT